MDRYPRANRRTFLIRLGAGLGCAMLGQGCRREQRDGPDHSELVSAIPAYEPIVRIRLRSDVAVEGVVNISSTSNWLQVRMPGQEDPVHLPGPVTFSCPAGNWSLEDRFGKLLIQGDVPWLEVEPIGPVPTGESPDLVLDEVPYPGHMRLIRSVSPDAPGEGNDSLVLVNHASMESYLPGVLERELYAYWHHDTHAALAVAARSFACSEIQHSARRHWDLVDSAVSQVYRGRSSSVRCRAAVLETRGMVLAWKNQLVPGYYSSCCGGRAAPAIDAIGSHPANALPPLTGHLSPCPCHDAPRYSWSLTRTLDDVTAGFQFWAREHGYDDLAEVRGLKSIAPASTSTSGRVMSYRLAHAGGPAITIAASRLREALSAVTDGRDPLPHALHSSWMDVSIDTRRNQVGITGHGDGHGAGLCQYGAQYHADKGMPWRAILARYYPGTGITRAWQDETDDGTA